MTPQPPALSSRMSRWKPQELFTLVKHGVKFTGMPAWPAPDREDEVWDMVAFLRRMPEMNAGEYETASGQDTVVPAGSAGDLIAACARCHGPDGAGRDGAFPVLAGQRKEYLKRQLEAYRTGDRASGFMQPVAERLTDGEIEAIAAYYPSLETSVTARSHTDPAAVQRGRAIAEEGIPGQRVPSCVDCHGQHGTETKPWYPVLAGQDAGYLERQLVLFSRGLRGGSDSAHLMGAVAPRLSPEQMRDVANYFASPVPREARAEPAGPDPVEW
jgi:cytochrome c553